jgi:cell division GTPase FtsZ
MAVSALEAAVDTLIIISNDRLLKGEQLVYKVLGTHTLMVLACVHSTCRLVAGFGSSSLDPSRPQQQ